MNRNSLRKRFIRCFIFENRKNKEISDLADEYFENDMRLDDFILKAQAIVDKLEYVETIVKRYTMD